MGTAGVSGGRTGADDVCGERHGEERGDPVPELDNEDRSLGFDLVEGVKDAYSGRCLQKTQRTSMCAPMRDVPVLPSKRTNGNATIRSLRPQTR